MSARPWLRIVEINDHLVLLSGPCVGTLLVQAGGKPFRSRRYNAWATTSKRATDVEALAREAGYSVEWVDERAAKLVDLSPTHPKPAKPITVVESGARQLELGLGDAS